MKSSVFAVFVLLGIAPGYAQTPIKGSVTLIATASDVTPDPTDTECGVAYVQFFNGAVPIGPQITTPATDGTFQLALDTKTLPNGSYTFTAKAVDKAGPEGACDGTSPNTGTSAPLQVAINNIPPDVTPPVITIKVDAVITISIKP